MERLGFGNMYVHTAMFLLLCVAPFWVFNITALHIHDYDLSDAVGAAGIALCFLGLLYGGFWRVQMRKRFALPGSRWCCVSASLTDYARWLFCWPCALAQEVRTGNLYDVEDGGGGFYEKAMDGGDVEGGAASTAATGVVPVSVGGGEGDGVVGDIKLGMDGEMIPPAQAVMETSGDTQGSGADVAANGDNELSS